MYIYYTPIESVVPLTYTCSIERGLWIFRDCIDDSCWDCPKPACMCLRTPVWNTGWSDCGGLPIFQCCIVECVSCQHFDCFWFLQCHYPGQWRWVIVWSKYLLQTYYPIIACYWLNLIHSTSIPILPSLVPLHVSLLLLQMLEWVWRDRSTVWTRGPLSQCVFSSLDSCNGRSQWAPSLRTSEGWSEVKQKCMHFTMYKQ